MTAIAMISNTTAEIVRIRDFLLNLYVVTSDFFSNPAYLKAETKGLYTKSIKDAFIIDLHKLNGNKTVGSISITACLGILKYKGVIKIFAVSITAVTANTVNIADVIAPPKLLLYL